MDEWRDCRSSESQQPLLHAARSDTLGRAPVLARFTSRHFPVVTGPGLIMASQRLLVTEALKPNLPGPRGRAPLRPRLPKLARRANRGSSRPSGPGPIASWTLGCSAAAPSGGLFPASRPGYTAIAVPASSLSIPPSTSPDFRARSSTAPLISATGAIRPRTRSASAQDPASQLRVPRLSSHSTSGDS